MAPASSADEPRPGETRAERRRRLQAEQWQHLPEPNPGPYDPRPYGVHAYPDIEDAVVEEYVEVADPATPAPPAPYAVPNSDATPSPTASADFRATDSGSDTDSGFNTDSGSGDLGAATGTPTRTAADTGREEPSRHVAHRAYGGPGPAMPLSAAPAPPAATPASPAPTPAPPAAAPAPVAPGAGAPAGDPGAAGDASDPPTLTPLADLADAEDPAAAAARLQLLAARAAADRLAAPRKAIAADTAAAPAAADAAHAAAAARAQSPPSRSSRAERERRAAEKIAADKVAAARLAAVRAAAAQRESGATRAVRAENQLAQAAAPAARPALPSAPTKAGPPTPGSPASPGAARPTPAGAPARPAAAARPAARRPTTVTPRWAKVAYSTAAIAVLAGGIALTVPHAGALISLGQPAATPTESAATPATSASASATDTPSTAAAPTAVSSAMACDPAPWVSELTGEAPEAFTASGVAQAYCLTAGTMRDIGFTDLAAKKSTPYTAADFAFVGPYLSPALRARWDKDVAEFVASQDLAGAAAKRISALTFLAWDANGNTFDPAVKVRSTDFAVGKPVTWVVKGSDGVARLGVGFETGIVTHMLDAAGRKQDRILKRTYKVLLVKGDATHPWLIDAYEIGQSTAGLTTTTVAPTTAAPSGPATPTKSATR